MRHVKERSVFIQLIQLN